MKALMEADLERSGISADAAAAAGFECISAQDIARRFGVKVESDGYVIPYRGLDGQALTDPADGKPVERVRLFDPAGKRKYVTRAGASWTTYIPAGLDELLDVSGQPVDAGGQKKIFVITEGEKKALAGVLAGIPCVGLPGVSMWHDPLWRREAGEKLDPVAKIEPALLALCQKVAARGYYMLVLSDSDADENGLVRNAMRGLAQALRHQVGYHVAYAACPVARDGSKMGLDDWILAARAGDAKSLDMLQSMAMEPVQMPRRVQIPSGSVPDYKAVDLHNPDLPEQTTAWLIVANLIAAGVPAELVALRKAWEGRFAGHKLAAGAIFAGIRYMQILDRGGALCAYLPWPVAGRSERNLWQVESWKDGVQVKALDSSPAAWYSELVSLVESTDHLLPPEKRPLRLEAEMVGLVDTGETRRVLIPNDLITDKKAWRLAGFDGVTDAGIVEWQKLMSVGKAQFKQRLGVTDKGWITLPDGKGDVYVYGQQIVSFGADSDKADILVHDGTGAAAQLASGVRCGGSAERQYAYLTELFKASPALAGICGFAAVAPASRYISAHETGIVHIYGTSSGGKTTTLQLVASLSGIGASTGNPDSQIMSWRTTDNGLESPAEARRGSALLIDELHMIPDPKMLAGALYMLANGEGKSRMKADTTMRMRKSWKTQIISTGERSVEFALASADPRRGGLQSVPGGLLFRVVDLPASKAGLIPTADRVPGLMRNYGDTGTVGRPEAVAHALEKAVQTDFGHVWPELVRCAHKHSDELPGLYAQAEAQIKSSPGFNAGNIMSRRVKHAAGALVGVMLLLEVVGADTETSTLVIAQALDWLTRVMLPAGAEDLADGKAESELQFARWAEALLRNVGRLDARMPNALGWRRGGSDDGDGNRPDEICLHASAVAELSALAGVENKIIEDELHKRYPQGTTARRAAKSAPVRKVWILPGRDFRVVAGDGDDDADYVARADMPMPSAF